MQSILEHYNNEWKNRIEHDKELLIHDFDAEVYEFLKHLNIIDAKRKCRWDVFDEMDIESFVITARSINFTFEIHPSSIHYTGENIFKRKFDKKWQESRLNKNLFTTSEFSNNPYNQQKEKLVQYIVSHFKSREIVELIENKQKNGRLDELFTLIKDKKIINSSIETLDARNDEFYIQLENGMKLLVKHVD